MRRGYLDLANLLTISRVPLAVSTLVIDPSRSYLLWVMAVAGLSDVMDGWVARRSRTHSSSFGEWLDPVCDKTFLVLTLYAFWRRGYVLGKVALMIATREIVLAVLVLANFSGWVHRPEAPSAKSVWIGKCTTVVQFAAIAAFLLQLSWAMALACLSSLLGLASAGYYWRRWLVPNLSPTKLNFPGTFYSKW